MSEMEARVAGISTGAWHDPHNNGIYSQQDKGANELTLPANICDIRFTFRMYGSSSVPLSSCLNTVGER